MVPVTRVDITPAAGSYLDIDVTAHVSAGATAGVMLEIINTNAGTNLVWGVRKNGSGDTHENLLRKGGHTWVAIGIDGNDIFEAYVQSTLVKVYIVGYITDAEGGFLLNAVDKSLGSTGSWLDINISGDTGGDTAICAFFLIRGSSVYYGLRKNGSSDTRTGQIYPSNSFHGAMMSVDGGEILEANVSSTAVEIWFVGWLTDNMLDWANAKDYQTANTGAWEEVDMSGDIPAGWDGAFCHFHGFSGERLGGIRILGSAFENYRQVTAHAYLWVETDEDRKTEQKIVNTDLDLWLWGYTQQPSPAPTAPTVLQVDGKSTPVGVNCVTATPYFTAIFNDPDAGDTSNAFQIQVGSASGLSDMWDSGWLADATVEGNRCAAKTYDGVALSQGTSYWWRCRFRDDGNAEGAWSSWQQFDVCAVAAEIGLLECAPGGPLPKRCPFRCAVALPRRVPSWLY